MGKIIAFCGLDCSVCPAYMAYKTDDDELRTKTAEKWSKEYGADMKPEDIDCAGCLETEGPHIGHCGECEIRKCGQIKGVANCAYCDEYACDKLIKFFEMVPTAKETLEQIRANL